MTLYLDHQDRQNRHGETKKYYYVKEDGKKLAYLGTPEAALEKCKFFRILKEEHPEVFEDIKQKIRIGYYKDKGLLQ